MLRSVHPDECFTICNLLWSHIHRRVSCFIYGTLFRETLCVCVCVHVCARVDTNFTTSIVVFWVVTPCNLVLTNISEHVSPLSSLTSTLKMEVIRSSETLVSSFKTIRCHNPEDRNPHSHGSENLKTL
jgi:hypothetical protein